MFQPVLQLSGDEFPETLRGHVCGKKHSKVGFSHIFNGIALHIFTYLLEKCELYCFFRGIKERFP